MNGKWVAAGERVPDDLKATYPEHLREWIDAAHALTDQIDNTHNERDGHYSSGNSGCLLSEAYNLVKDRLLAKDLPDGERYIVGLAAESLLASAIVLIKNLRLPIVMAVSQQTSGRRNEPSAN